MSGCTMLLAAAVLSAVLCDRVVIATDPTLEELLRRRPDWRDLIGIPDIDPVHGLCGVQPLSPIYLNQCECTRAITGVLLTSNANTETFAFDLSLLGDGILENAQLNLPTRARENFIATCRHDDMSGNIVCLETGVEVAGMDLSMSSSGYGQRCLTFVITQWMLQRDNRQLQIVVPVCGLANNHCDVTLYGPPVLSVRVSYYGNNGYHCQSPNMCNPQFRN